MTEIGEKRERIIGKVSLKDGEYLLELPPAYRQKVEGERNKIFLGMEGNEQLRGLEKAEVEVLLSEPKSFVIGLITLKASDPRAINRRILCYAPSAVTFRDFTVDQALINRKLEHLVKMGVISSEVQSILNDRQIG
jgi:hypothetical protein